MNLQIIGQLVQRTINFISGTEYDIFISYKRNDADFYGSSLAEYLTSKKYRCYFDQHVREEGQEKLPKSLRLAARNSRMLVILGTDNADQSKWMRQEIRNYLKRKSKNVIPIDFGQATTHKWFQMVKDFHSTKENPERLNTGTPSKLIQDTITNAFNFRRRNETLQHRAVLMIVGIFLALGATALVANKFVQNARSEMRKAITDKNTAMREADNYKNISNKAIKDKEEADVLKNDAIRQTEQAQDEKENLERENEKVQKNLRISESQKKLADKAREQADLARVRAEEAESTATSNYKRADSLAREQENIAAANIFAATGLQQLESDPTSAFLHAKQGWKKHHNENTLKAVYTSYVNQDLYEEVHSFRGLEFVRFLAPDTVISSYESGIYYHRMDDAGLTTVDSVKFSHKKNIFPGNIHFYKPSKLIIAYNDSDSSIDVIENRFVHHRNLPRKIGGSAFYDFSAMEIIDDSTIAFADSSMTRLTVFDWRRNKIVSSLNLPVRFGESPIDCFTIVDDENILFAAGVVDETNSCRIYKWNWKIKKKPVYTGIETEGISISSMEIIRDGDHRYLCLGNNYGQLTVWEGRNKIIVSQAHHGSVKKMHAFKNTLITIGSDHLIQLFRIHPPSNYNSSSQERFDHMKTLKGHKNDLFDFDYDNDKLISTDLDYRHPAKLWRFNSTVQISQAEHLKSETFFDFLWRDEFYDTTHIVRKKDGYNSLFFRKKDLKLLPFLSNDFISINVNTNGDNFIVCSKGKNKVFILDSSGNDVDSLPDQEKVGNYLFEEEVLSADFILQDSLIAVAVSNRRSFRSNFDTRVNSIVKIYDRKWRLITSFSWGSSDFSKLAVWNGYLYERGGNYARIPLEPELMSNRN